MKVNCPHCQQPINFNLSVEGHRRADKEYSGANYWPGAERAVMAFIGTLEPGRVYAFAELRDAYAAWAPGVQAKALTDQWLARLLKDGGCSRFRTADGSYYRTPPS